MKKIFLLLVMMIVFAFTFTAQIEPVEADHNNDLTVNSIDVLLQLSVYGEDVSVQMSNCGKCEDLNIILLNDTSYFNWTPPGSGQFMEYKFLVQSNQDLYFKNLSWGNQLMVVPPVPVELEIYNSNGYPLSQQSQGESFVSIQMFCSSHVLSAVDLGGEWAFDLESGDVYEFTLKFINWNPLGGMSGTDYFNVNSFAFTTCSEPNWTQKNVNWTNSWVWP